MRLTKNMGGICKDLGESEKVTVCKKPFALSVREQPAFSFYACNIKTVLAEQMETVISRGLANIRLREFCHLYILQQERKFPCLFSISCQKTGDSHIINYGEDSLNKDGCILTH